MSIAREHRVDLAVPARRAAADLPEGWALARLAEVVAEVPNVNPGDEPHRDFGYVDISSICNDSHRILDHKRFEGKDAPSRARRPIRPADVLFSNVRTYLRNVAMVPPSLDVQLCSTGFTVLRSNGAVDPALLFRYVLTDDFIDRVTPQQTGTHYPATSDRVVMGETMPLPPLAEQQRIVAKVEALLARVNAARQRLAKVPAILKRFRQSVLAAACSGRLTAEWRAEQGKLGPDGELPETWKERPLSELCTAFEYGSSQKSQKNGKVPVLRMGNIQDGKIDWSDLVYSNDEDEIRKYSLAPNTVLFNRTNSPELVGKTAIYRGERPAMFAGYLIRIVTGPELDPGFLNLSLNAPNFKEYCQAVKTDGVSQSNINATKLAAYSLNWCLIAEQHEIVRRVEALFRLADAIEKRVAAATARAEKLTQAILAKAFRGELVPTEAELARREGRPYEPASILLERVRAERTPGTSRLVRSPRKKC